MLVLELIIALDVIGLVNVVAAFIVKGLLPFNSEKAPDKPVTVPLELILFEAIILPVELILPKALTLKLLNDPDNAVTVALELIFPDAVISPNASTLNLVIEAEVALIFFHFKAVEPKS